MDKILQPNPRVLQALRAVPNQVAEFRLKLGTLRAGAVCGLLLGGAGVGLVAGVLQSDGNPCWCLLGLGLLPLGGSLMLLMKRLESMRIWVAPRGLIFITLGTGDGCRCFRVESPEPAGMGFVAAPRDADGASKEAAPMVRAAVPFLKDFSKRWVHRVL
jgi:hypothetical protein